MNRNTADMIIGSILRAIEKYPVESGIYSKGALGTQSWEEIANQLMEEFSTTRMVDMVMHELNDKGYFRTDDLESWNKLYGVLPKEELIKAVNQVI